MADTAERTSQEMAAVSAHLSAQGGVWTATPPAYSGFFRDRLLRNLQDVAVAVATETNAEPREIARALEASQYFVNRSFDYFEGRRGIGRRIGRAFCVPMRSSRDDHANASESLPFFELYDPARFGVDSNIRMRGMYGLPPTILDTYTRSGIDEEAGALVLVPMYSDMLRDLWPNRSDPMQASEMAAVADSVLTKAAWFARYQLGAQVLGLGATLPHPTVTNFGQRLRDINGMSDLVTTTGHGGTVYMIIETIKKILCDTPVRSNGRIGVLGGAGSIGRSTSVAALEMVENHRIYSYDKRPLDLAGYERLSDKIEVAASAADVLRRCNIVVAAVTGRIDLNHNEFDDIDLDGKVIIDDSQPGCFDRDQVEARNGRLVWVVGEDGSDSKFMTRDGLYTAGIPYNYGDDSGLYGYHSEFACGQEAAVIAKYDAREHAITAPVTPHDVMAIGKLFDDAGVRVAPFQACGRPVLIS